MAINTAFNMLVDDQLEAIMALLTTNPVVIDDHGPKAPVRERRVEGVVLVKNNHLGLFICPIFRKEWCSLNRLYIGADGRVHLSTQSVSGNLQGFPRHDAGFQLDSIESIREVSRCGTDAIHDVMWLDTPAPKVA